MNLRKRFAAEKLVLLLVIVVCGHNLKAQKSGVKESAVPCNDSADALPGRYTDHTNPKYPHSLKGLSQNDRITTH